MTQPASQTPPTPFEPMKEVRFAIVLYGGVSLAIYINGVVQELLRLVQATAPSTPYDGTDPQRPLIPDEKLVSSQKVYRKLGRMLGFEPQNMQDGHPILRRFVVDILAGSSAGGINAVYLAKALTNNSEMQTLKELWKREADIQNLVNDKRAAPRALLDGDWMYKKLLEALEAVNGQDQASPYVEELDLYITATDIAGLKQTLQLFDMVIQEPRHKNVFRFVYSTEFASGQARNDFTAKYNPMLAFAARCTSAIPFAFEPLALEDIRRYLPNQDLGEYARFFRDYQQPGDADPTYGKRAFSDGGILNNRPFGYAIDELSHHQLHLPIERKLIFVDPFADGTITPATATESLPAKPDALSNGLKTFDLLRAEPIGEDLKRISQINHLVERVERITRGLEDNLLALLPDPNALPELRQEDWLKMGLDKVLERYGMAYAGYHHLKVASVTDDLAQLIARVANLDENSAQFQAVRNLVRAWRDAHYTQNPAQGDPRQTQNRFLLEYDFSYRLRRLNFLRRKGYQFIGGGPRVQKLIGLLSPGAQAQQWSEEWREFRHTIKAQLAQLGQVYVGLRRLGRSLRSRDDNPLKPLVEALGLKPDALKYALFQNPSPEADPQERLAQAALQLDVDASVVQPLFSALADSLRQGPSPLTGFVEAARQCLGILELPQAQDPASVARRCLRHYYVRFEDYDQALFPITYQTEAEQASKVEVLRISSADARSLVDEVNTPRRKLAGTSLGAFGAFFKPEWRVNDIFWGRMDAAERLINALLPEADADDYQALDQREETRKALLQEAQEIIIQEELVSQRAQELPQILSESLLELQSKPSTAQAVKQAVGSLELSPQDVASVFQSLMKPDQLRQFFQTQFQVNRNFLSLPFFQTGARALWVSGILLGAKQATVGRAISSLGRIGTVLITLLLYRGLPLLYGLGLLVTLAGLLTNTTAWRNWGVVILLLAFLGNYLYSLGQPRQRSLLAGVGRTLWGLLGLGLAVCVVLALVEGVPIVLEGIRRFVLSLRTG